MHSSCTHWRTRSRTALASGGISKSMDMAFPRCLSFRAASAAGPRGASLIVGERPKKRAAGPGRIGIQRNRRPTPTHRDPPTVVILRSPEEAIRGTQAASPVLQFSLGPPDQLSADRRMTIVRARDRAKPRVGRRAARGKSHRWRAPKEMGRRARAAHDLVGGRAASALGRRAALGGLLAGALKLFALRAVQCLLGLLGLLFDLPALHELALFFVETAARVVISVRPDRVLFCPGFGSFP